MKEGDWIKIVKQSTKCNPHIKMVGYIGKIDEINDWGVSIKCSNGGFGAVEIECVEPYSPTLEEKLEYKSWWSE